MGAADGSQVRRIAPFLLLTSLTFVAFVPALGNGFVLNYDDGLNLWENPSFRGLGASQIFWAWRTTLLGVYQPLAWMEFSAQFLLWGLAPWGYHLVSVAWHAANVCLVSVLIDRLVGLARPGSSPFDRRSGAIIGAAMFAVHPLRVEVVAWASCQPYLPCVFFSLLASLTYLRAHTSGPRGLMLLACWLLQATALLHKAIAVPLPAIFLILDAFPLRRFAVGTRTRVWLEKLPFFFLSVVFGTIAYLARREAGGPADLRGLTERLAQASDAAGFYLLKTIKPVQLTLFLPLPSHDSISQSRLLLTTGSLLGLSLLLLVLRRRWPAATATWGAYLVLLGPNSGLIRNGPMGLADRYSYFPTIGFFILAGAGFAWLRESTRTRLVANAATVLACLVILILVGLTWRQSRIWLDAQAVAEHAVSVFAEAARGEPYSAEAHHNLGIALARCGRQDESMNAFRAAIGLDPGMGAPHAALGQILATRDQPDEAIAELSRSVRLEPAYADVHGTLARVLLSQGRIAEAESEYREARRLDPANPFWRAGIGFVLFRRGRLAEAESELADALRCRPNDPQLLGYLQLVRQARGGL